MQLRKPQVVVALKNFPGSDMAKFCEKLMKLCFAKKLYVFSSLMPCRNRQFVAALKQPPPEVILPNIVKNLQRTTAVGTTYLMKRSNNFIIKYGSQFFHKMTVDQFWETFLQQRTADFDTA